MKFAYPHVIENCIGEKLIFKELQKEPDGDRLLVDNYVQPWSWSPDAYTLAAG